LTAPYRRAPRPSTAPESFNVVLGLVQVDKKAAKKTAAMPRSQNPAALTSGPKFFDFSIMRYSSLAESAESLARVVTRYQLANLEEVSVARASLPRTSSSLEKSLALPQFESESGECDIPCFSNADTESQDCLVSEVRASSNPCSMIVDVPQVSDQVS
jgi:hypothetical protein